MNEKINKVRNLVENVIRVSDVLIKKGLIEEEEGEQILRCLKGIRQRFLSEDYMSKSPVGEEIDAIDQMILPLDRMLVDAGKKKYKNTISYIIKAVVCGAGNGHRILTKEEEDEAKVVLMKRRIKVGEYLEDIRKAQSLDEQIAARREVLERQEECLQKYLNYEKRQEQIRNSDSDILEEILYYTDVDELSDEAAEYLDLGSAMVKIKQDIADTQKNIVRYNTLVRASEKELNLEPTEEVQQVVDLQTMSRILEMEDEESINNDSAEQAAGTLVTDAEDEETIKAEMKEMQKLMKKFVDEDGPDMIDLLYESMENLFASREVRDYVTKGLNDYEAHGLADDDDEI